MLDQKLVKMAKNHNVRNIGVVILILVVAAVIAFAQLKNQDKISFNFSGAASGIAATCSGWPSPSVTLSWSDFSTTGEGYKIFRDGSTLKSDVFGTNFVDTSVVANKTYKYAIQSIASSNSGRIRKNVSATVDAANCKPKSQLSPNASSASSTTSPFMGHGQGLHGDAYYLDSGLNDHSLGRIGPATIDFDWGSGVLFGRNDDFAIVWRGEIEAQYSETYTFYLGSDDDSVLLVDSPPGRYNYIIDNSGNHAMLEKQGTYNMVAGQRYNIQVGYGERTGNAAIQLFWSSPSTPKQIVPKTQLYSPDPNTNPQPTPPPATVSATGSIRSDFAACTKSSSNDCDVILNYNTQNVMPDGLVIRKNGNVWKNIPCNNSSCNVPSGTQIDNNPSVVIYSYSLHEATTG